MSLRTRLNLAYIGLFALAMVVLHSALYLFVRQSLLGAIDNELQLGARLLQQDFAKSNTKVPTYFSGNRLVVALAEPNVAGFERTSLIAQVNDTQRGLVAHSPNIASALPLDGEAFERAKRGSTSYGTLESADVRLRVLIVPLVLTPTNESPVVVGVITVARSMDESERALTLLAYALAGGGVLALLVAARGGTWLTRAAFRPIDEVVRTAQGIVSASDLRSRVPVPEAEDELRRLVVTINELLGRLQGLFEAQRRLSADVSHELRTPLTAMQGNLEVLARGAARDPQLLEESLGDMRREVARLIRMTNDLLLLAQTDAGLQLRREPVELDLLLLEVLRELRPLAGAVQLRLGGEDQAIVIGDRDRIKQALLNLGVNAIQHTPAGGSVTLSLACASGEATLTVEDTGVGIPADSLPQIFERFFRADQSRSRNRGGAGLGLAIVKWIADAHGGRVAVTSSVGVGSRFTIALPLAGQPAAPLAEQPERQLADRGA